MKSAVTPRRVLALVALCALVGLVIVLTRPAPPAIYENESARIDASALGDGMITVAWLGDGGGRVRLGVQKEGGTQYLYELDPDGRADTFALTEGDGTYTVHVYRHLAEKRYQTVFSHTLTLRLDDPLRPFLRPSAMVNYENCAAVETLSYTLTDGMVEDGAKFAAILDYITANYTYDQEWANTVDGSDTPVLEDIINLSAGNCADLSVLTASLLRVCGIPCTVAVGWAGDVYHAWIQVFLDGEWVHCDPTFLLGGAEDFAKEPSNYLPLFFY